MEYNEEDFLQISGIQHFLFCKRQWALIHIENQWAENYLTTVGELMHENVHNPEYHEKRKNKITQRALRVYSASIGISGECDVVEFINSEEGINLINQAGKWIPYPVEYKRGKEKTSDSDKAQLCAQAMCIEDMYCCDVPKGALFYGETRHRIEVDFTKELREKVLNSVELMHHYMMSGYTPKPVKSKACNSCSLKDLCLPELERNVKVSAYMRKFLEE